MSNVLVEHAKQHVWQEPSQDRQFNIGLGRLTKNGGFIGSTPVLWHRVLSPTRHEPGRKFHHLYQIGQISPITLNLVDSLVPDQWRSAQEIVDGLNILIEVYFESGGIVPLSHVWLMRDFTDNLLLCIWNNPNTDYGILKTVSGFNGDVSYVPISGDSDKLITRFYTNSQQSNTQFNQMSGVSLDSVKTTSLVINNVSDYNQYISATSAIRNEFNQKGMGLWYEDGFLVNAPTGYDDSKRGKTFTFVWDETFKFRQFFALKDIPTFVSERDNGRKKYLLLCDTVYDVIDYYDDVDFYLVAGTPGDFKGVYLNRAGDKNIRQVTHNAYAVDADMVLSYARRHEFLESNKNTHILIQVREGGMSKPTLSQSNRIDELFKLPYSLILNAFRNTDSVAEEWRAATLENSDYIKLMGAQSFELTPELVTGAYGYPGITTSVLNPIGVVNSGLVDVPVGLQVPERWSGLGQRTVFCYNESGMYLGYLNNNDTRRHILVSGRYPATRRVECFRMKTVLNGEFSGIHYNKDVIGPDLEEYGFRAYICPLVNGRPTEKWDDVTGSVFYTFIPGTDKTMPRFEWNWDLLSNAGQVGCIKVNKYVLINAFKFTKANYSGVLSFTLTALHDWSNSFELRTQTIAPAVIEVFANGEQMIQGIDYHIDFPVIVLNNASALKFSEVDITVRSYGCGDPDTMQPYPPVETGFVAGGYLSLNGGYDITKHRSNKVVLNSRVVDKSTVRFSEYAQSGSLYPTDGRPYMVLDYVVNVEPFATESTTSLYKSMRDTDTRLGEYLTQFLPEVVVDQAVVQTGRWSLVSPVVSSILHAFLDGYMDSDRLPPTFSLQDMDDWFDRFRWLLKYDPAFINIDPRYTDIIPHPYEGPMQCTAQQYSFVEKICSFYLNSRVDLTNYVEIG